MRQSILALSLVTALAACAGDAGPSDPGDDTDDPADDPSGEGDDDGFEDERPSACPSGEMGAVASLTDAFAYNDPAGETDESPERYRFLSGYINDTTGFDLELYDGYGAFEGTPAAPGTFPIGGDDADPELCGLCVWLWMETDEWSYYLLADSGSVTLETVDGSLKGSASSLTFKELADEGGFLEGGCTATIESIAFDTPYETYEEE